jgi:diguanylate cyclase (GGDEF)-like protein
MLLRWYAAVSFALVAGYPAVPAQWRGVVFLLVTLAAVPAVLIGARRGPAGARLPWWLLLAGLVLFNGGNVLWIYYVEAQGRATGDGTLADLMFALASLLMLAGSMVVVVRRGRRDVGGVLDAAVTALAVGGLVWSVVLLPHLTAAGAPPGRQAAVFVQVLVMIGGLGAMLRVSLVASRRIVATWLLAAGQLCTLVSHLAVVLCTDPVTSARPDWTNMPFMLAYAALGCAALHPSASLVTRPDAAPVDDLSTGRLTFLGLMAAAGPLIGGGRAVVGLPTDGLLLAVGSAMVIPLIMIRIARLAAQRRTAEQALRTLARSDALTGLPNRAACLERVTAELAAPPGGDRLALLFCDLDGFKPVNDRLGHAAGDALLIEVAARLRGCLRAEDLVSRFGGDEFVILCRSGDVDAICARISDMVGRSFAVSGEEVRIGVSVGVAHAGPGSTTDDLIGRADLAMYAAKRSKAVGALTVAAA